MAGWQLLSTRPGGTVASLAPAGPHVFAATAAGVRQSADSAKSWERLAAGGLAPPIEIVAASPAFERDRTLFAAAAAGLYRSTDGGASWRHVLTGARVLTLALSPAYERDGVLFAGTETDGILRSDDGGRNWTSGNPGLLDLTVLALALSPGFEADRTGFAATASGLYRTRNGGRAWREVEQPLGEAAVQCLAVSPGFAEDRLVLAGTEADGLVRSDDGGVTWQAVPAFAGRSVTAIACSLDHSTRPTFAVGTAENVLHSDDGGVTWRPIGEEIGPVLSLAFVPGEAGEALLAGLPGRGVVRSEGDGWRSANVGLAGSLLVGLAASPDFARDRTLFTAGLEDGVAGSTDGGRSWMALNDGLAEPAVFGLALSPSYATDRTLYATTATGLYRSGDGGASWQPVSAEAAVGALAIGSAGDGIPAPIVATLGADRLLISLDGGLSWQVRPGPPGGGDIVSLACPSGGPDGPILLVGTAAPAPDGSFELALWRSADGGGSWQRRLAERGPRALPLALVAGTVGAPTPLVGVGPRLLRPLGTAEEVRGGERRPIWHGPSLPDPAATINAIASAGAIVVATSTGVCISRDGGATLEAWDEGLDGGPIVALTTTLGEGGERLVFGLGLGGAIWMRTLDGA